jgi:hypothetical protein
MTHSPAAGPITMASRSEAEKHLVDFARLRQRMPVGRDHVERHPLYLQREKQGGANIGNAPELHFSGADVHQRGCHAPNPAMNSRRLILDPGLGFQEAYRGPRRQTRAIDDRL